MWNTVIFISYSAITTAEGTEIIRIYFSLQKLEADLSHHYILGDFRYKILNTLNPVDVVLQLA